MENKNGGEKLAGLFCGPKPEIYIYREINGRTLRLLTVKPQGWAAGDRRPAVVWIHGGGWNSGRAEWFLPHCRYFSMLGAVSISIEYRLLGEEAGSVELNDCIKDCRAALRFLRENAHELGINQQKITVVGDSAGGHLALCLGTSILSEADADCSDVPDAVVDCNGITDLTGLWKKDLPPVSGDIGDGVDEAGRWLEHYALEKSYSPVYNVAEGQPPALILHGLNDSVVQPADAVRFYEKYSRTGNDAELILYPYFQHAFILFNYMTPANDVLLVLNDIENFLRTRGLLG